MLASWKRLSGATALAVVASGFSLLPLAPASANPAGTGLVINEVYGGGGNSGAAFNNDFIELHNPSDGAISVNGLSLQYRAATGTGAPGTSNVFALPNKTIQPGGYFLVQAAPGATVTDKPLPVTPDAQTTGTNLNLSGTGGQIYLVNGTTALDAGTGTISNANVVDFVGWGTTTTSYEGAVVAPATRNSAPATANATSISRKTTGDPAVVQDTDSNSADFATATTPTPTTTSVAAPLTATDPGDKTAFVGTAIAPINLAATGGTSPYTWQAAPLPAGLSLDGNTISGTPTTAGTTEVTITATDAATPTAGTDTETFSITVSEAPIVRPIAEVQGTGDRSPFAPASGTALGDTVSIQGVVTGMFADVSWAGTSSGYDGMYVQTAGTGGTTDATSGASDAVFVYGANSMPAGVVVGDSVEVTGRVSEFSGTTEITPAAGGVTELGSPLDAVTPLEIAYPATEAGREAQEGMLLAPTDTFTVTNSYNTNFYGEVGLATGTTPLKQPTEYAQPGDTAGIQAIKDENASRAVTLDDGTAINYTANQTNKGQPVPYLTKADNTANPIRVGAEATLESGVILEYRNNIWKFQPSAPVTTNGASVITFEDTRASNLVPQNVGGDLKIATFNVLNYFNTTGEAYVAAGPLQNPPIDTHCTYYTDRASNRIGNDSCGTRGPGINPPNDGRGPRGAATAASLARQEAKLANTLLALDAEVVGLEEVENSIKLPGETNRDDATARIVEMLNTATAPGTWAYVKSPGESLTAAAVAEQDVIRPSFIYQTEAVEPVGQSDILFGSTEFANAREPLAQAFKAKGAPDSDAFAVIVNHFKSKGDNASPVPPATGDNANDSVTGVGAFNGDRVRQAERLVQFAEDFAAERDVDAIFLAGDFNSYTQEGPIKVLEEGGFELVESDQPGDESYSYQGNSGSLDHVLGNEAAMAMVTGADIWEINANESVAYQYSRYNYNVTDFWEPNLPFATSDHNPEIIGIDVPAFTPTTYKEIQVLGTNDFHGRLLPDAGNAAGAAPFATAVKELEAENPNSIFVAAGDLVGASTFESFIQDDEPTIDALNAMGLEVSAAGNHEFDRGYSDFVGRIQDRADWEYIAANVEEPAGQPDKLAETWTKTIDGVKVGFVGAVTEDLPALVNPAGIQGVTVTDVVDATNAAATDLKADGADLVVLLVHEGSPSTDCTSSSFTDAAGTWGNIVQNTSADVDAIISGHTHLAYNCRFTVDEWATDGRAVTKRPVVSAGQYGTNLNKLVFKLDPTTGDLAAVSQDVVATAGVGYAADPEVKEIVDSAVAFADEAGADVLGTMAGPFNRARYLPDGVSTENRGGESTLNNQVAEVQRWATAQAGVDTDIAFMNPGGLRADMGGTENGSKRDLTYRQAADVQPFANTLVNLKLTGAQLETVLEQQWQRNAQGGVPSRPFLRLGISKGFTYTYVETPETVSVPNSAPVSTFKGEVTGMWLGGKAIDPAKTYSVTVNSFLGGGGDNFWELANGTDKVDTGKVDLEAMVDYMARYQATPLPVDYSQRGVEVTFPSGAPESYAPGATVAFDVASWAMSANGDATDAEIQVKLGGATIGTATVDNTIGTAPYDNYGTAAVSVTLPESAVDGTRRLRLVGATTGTSIVVPIEVEDGDSVEDIQVLATNDFHGRLTRSPSSAEAGAAVLAGAVKQLRDDNPNTVFAAAGDLIGASTFESFIQDDKPTIDALNEAGLEVSAAGNHEFDQGYDDLVNRVMADYDAEDNPTGGAEWQYIAANVRLKTNDSHAIPASWIKDFGDVEVGFVGAVTEDLPSLVSPSGIEDLEVTGIVAEANAEADVLKEAGADIVVLLVHEGAATTNVAAATDDSAFGKIVTGVDGDIDAIVSGHTHLAYNHAIEVPAWVTEGRTVTTRPVVSAGQYGYNLNKLVFSYDTATDEVVALDQSIVALQSCTAGCAGSTQTWSANFTADPATTSIVDAAVAKADVLGAQKLGELDDPFNRAKLADGTTENRGGESTLGNLVAEVQRWATRAPESGSAQIAFMNPGGLRADMVGTGTGAFPRDLTYKQAAVVQPFANTLVNMDLTGAQIETILEQQWQRDGNNKLPSRPFLRLGSSEGFTYTYSVSTVTETPTNGDPAYQAPKGEVTGMWLNGEPIDPSETYSVTVNSFLASGGDNFRGFNAGTGKQDTGKVDLQAMVDYMAAAEGPVTADTTQHAVGVTFPSGAPESYAPGDEVAFAASSLAYSAPSDLKDLNVSVWLGNQPLRTIGVDNTLGTAVYDEYGTAPVTFVVPAGTPAGPTVFRVVGNQTGTEFPVTIQVGQVSGVSAGDDIDITWGEAASVPVQVTGNGTVTGSVRLYEGETPIGDAVTLTDGAATLPIAAKSLEPGEHTLRVDYTGNHPAASDEVVVTVAKATTAVTAGDVSLTYGQARTVTVTLGDATATGTVQVRKGETVLGSAAVSGGIASVNLPAGSLEPGVTTLTAAYAGDDHFEAGTDDFTATVAKQAATVSAANLSLVYGKPGTVTVNVEPSGASGTVQLFDGAKKIGSATAVSGGVAKVALAARSLDPGANSLRAEYSGDEHVAAGSDTFTVSVAKAASSAKVTASPGTAKLKKTRVTLRITISGPAGVAETGKVKVKVPGQGTETVTLRAGKATLKLKPFTSVGTKTIRIDYLGSDFLKSSSDTVKVKVKR